MRASSDDPVIARYSVSVAARRAAYRVERSSIVARRKRSRRATRSSSSPWMMLPTLGRSSMRESALPDMSMPYT